MLNLLKNKTVKKNILGVILISAPTLAKGTEGDATDGKGLLGVNQLSLETTPNKEISTCADEAINNGMSNDLFIVFKPFDRMELTFTVADIISNPKEQTLILAYSKSTSPSSQLITPRSHNEFMLDLASVEILAIYNIPSQVLKQQPKNLLGQAEPGLRSKVTFSVILDNLLLHKYMNNNPYAHLQAALLPTEDYVQGNFDNMILSEVETLKFVDSDYCQTSNPTL